MSKRTRTRHRRKHRRPKTYKKRKSIFFSKPRKLTSKNIPVNQESLQFGNIIHGLRDL
jgi:hypothetical protein